MHMRSAVVLLALLVTAPACWAQSRTEARKQQIVENLKFEIPQLQDFQVQVSDLEPTGTDGLERGHLIIPGQQPIPFLVTTDDTQLYLLAADPVDVSRSMTELATLQEQRAAQEAAAATSRHKALLAITEGLPIRGNPDAPVTIVEFSDFQCPYCARAAGTVEQLLEQRPDDVRFVFAHFPLPNHPWAKPASIAALCAAEQDEDAFWTLHDAYFEGQSTFTTGNVIAKSRSLLEGKGLDLATWESCAADESSASYLETATTVEKLLAAGRQFGVSGTPGFFINGIYASGAQPLNALEALVDQALASGSAH